MQDFVHLHVHTEYSLLDGVCRIRGLISRLKELGQTACAITDHGVMFGCVEFYKACKSAGIKPIIGCEVYVAPRTRLDKEGKQDSSPHHLILLCENNIGYKNLVKLVSDASVNGFYNKPRCDRETLRKYHEGLICLSACLSGEVPRHLLSNDYEAAKQAALDYREIFGKNNYFLELQDHGLGGQKKILPMLYQISDETGIPVVATNDAHYLTAEDAEIQRVLTAISTNTTVNSEKNTISSESGGLYIKSGDEMASLFRSSAIENTVKIAARCNVEIEFGKTKFPKYTIKNVTDNAHYFKDAVYNGLKERYGSPLPQAVADRARHEVGIITSMGYVDYFLIVADFIAYARSRDIPVGPGRGSGVGSICAYAMKITGIDPLRFDLLFERFLNPERVTMPDFDVDFCYIRRAEVIEYVYNKYGEDHVAQIITFGTLAAKAAIRDVGRALGLPYSKVDSVARMIPFSLNSSIERSLKEEKTLAEAVKKDPDIAKLISTALKLEGMPRHASIHAAGIVISREPVTEYVPVQKNDNTVMTQYPMVNLEELGLLKMDFLGLRYLTVIDDCVRQVRLKNPDFDIEKIDQLDSEVFAMLGRGQTAGVFQFESVGMTSVLTRLRPHSLEDLTAIISLYRPGPMQSIPKFIENSQHPDKIPYKHPLLKPILKVTYGCIVYQEQVMTICRELGGYSYGRADLVRRAMAKRKQDVMDKERSAFVYGSDTNCGAVKNGVPEAVANEIFDEMATFATYAFNKSHAAAYAYLAYQTAYLRCHYYKEYMIAMMTSVIDSQGKINEYIADLERNNVTVLPPDVNYSYASFANDGESLRYGLLAIKSISRGMVKAIISAREDGKFISLYDFCRRLLNSDLNKRALESLIRAGALDSLGHTRRAMLIAFENIMSTLSSSRTVNIEGQMDLFSLSDKSSEILDYNMPNIAEFTHLQLLQMEKEALGFYISGHPTENYEWYIKKHGYKSISALKSSVREGLQGYRDGQKQPLIVMLSAKKQHTQKNGKLMCFAEFEDKSGSIEGIIFSDLYEKNANSLQIGEIFRIVAAISSAGGYNDEDEPKLIINLIEKAETLGTNKKTLFIRFAEDEQDLQAEVLKLLEAESGADSVRFCYEKSREVKSPDGIKGVKITKELLAKLTKICEKGNILVK